jgi:acetylornithine deacetylase
MIDRGEARRVLDALVSFDTTSRNSNLALIEWVEAYLAAQGVASTRAASPDGTKANLFALVGPAAPDGVVLSGHTDVVPVDGQAWSSDPWTVRESDGRLFGRGVADMKSFVALSLAAVRPALEANLARPLILAFSYDEEVGCLGVPHLIAAMRGAVPTPRAVIVGEPTSMRAVSGHKSICTFTVTVEGVEAHSSQVEQGASAVMAAIPLMNLIVDMAAEARAEQGAEDALFSPPYPTMTVGVVEGGTASNILARRCSFVWDLRCPPGRDHTVYLDRFMKAAAATDAALKARFPQAGVTVERRSSTPAMAPVFDSEAETLVRAITGDNGTEAAGYAAEAGLFQGAGWPTMLCGPGCILQAHQPDEWISLEQFEKGAAFLDALVERLI